MAVASGTRTVGIVKWIDTKVNGIADVEPLYVETAEGWLPADLSNYPNHGAVFWRNPFDVSTDNPIIFELEDNLAGREQRYAVRRPEYLSPVLNFAHLEYPECFFRVTQLGFPIVVEVAAGQNVYVLCKGDRVLGPFDTKIEGDRFFLTYESKREDRVPYRSLDSSIFRLSSGRMVCDPTPHASGYLDCRSDEEILKTALKYATHVARNSGAGVPKFLETKALISSAVPGLLAGQDSTERQINAARIDRALAICEDSATIQKSAAVLGTTLLDHPDLQSEIDSARNVALRNAHAAAEEEIAAAFKSEQKQLDNVRTSNEALRLEYDNIKRELTKARSDLSQSSESVARQLDSLENAVVERITTLVDDATDLLADSVLFRAIGVGQRLGPVSVDMSVAGKNPSIDSHTRSPFPEDLPAPSSIASSSIRQTLESAARTDGTNIAALRRIHAAIRAGLIPITTGNGGHATLATYATAACGGRITSLPIAHDFLHPVDLLGVRAADPSTTRMHGSLLVDADRNVRENGVGILILDSLNRAPTDSYLLPWLQSRQRGISIPENAQTVLRETNCVVHEDLLLAATTTVGVATAPLSPDMWGFCIAVDVPLAPRPGVHTVNLTTMPYGDIPPLSVKVEALVDALGRTLEDYWPIDEGVLDTAGRFAAALSEVESGETLEASVIECLLIPALATSLSERELVEAVDAIADRNNTPTPDVRRRLQQIAQRFRRRFA